MLITFKTLSAQQVTLDVSPETPISEVKKMLIKRLGVTGKRLRLVLRGQELADTALAGSITISESEFVIVMMIAEPAPVAPAAPPPQPAPTCPTR